MSQPEHPSADRISDLLAGSLPAAEAMSVNAHLSGCAACADMRADLLDVTATLAAEGAADWPMPPDVAAGLDAALAQAAAQRAEVEGSAVAGGSTEVAPAAERSPGSRRRLQWLAGAAAAVLVVGVGFAGIQAISHNGGNTSSSATSGADQSAGQERSGHSNKLGGSGSAPVAIPPPGSAGAGHIVHSLTKSDVPARARRLADHAATGKTAQMGRCEAPAGGPAAVVLWHGKAAVLALRTASRTATIVDCKTGQTSLYVTHY